MKWKNAASLILIVAVASIFIIRNKVKLDNIEYDVIDSMSLEIEGHVYKKKLIDANAGLIFLTVDKSNVKSSRADKNDRFICKIHDEKAVLVNQEFNKVEIGDSVRISSSEKVSYFYREGVEYKANKFWVSRVDIFWQEIDSFIENSEFSEN